MKHRVEDLDGALLDFAVALAEGLEANVGTASNAPGRGPVCGVLLPTGWFFPWSPSTDWAQGGLIIERERIDLRSFNGLGGTMWTTQPSGAGPYAASSPLVAAMRTYVARKLGDTVELP